MTISDFVERVKTRHENTNVQVLKEIKTFLVGFTEEQLDKLNGLYSSSQESKFPPKGIYVFESIAKTNAIFKQDEKHDVLWWVCDNCGANFSFKSRGCPRCQSKRFRGELKPQYPSDFIHVQDGCYSCKIYLSGMKPQGPSCHEYGKVDNGMIKAGYPVQLSMCHGCRCALCCSEEYACKTKDQDRLLALQGRDSVPEIALTKH